MRNNMFYSLLMDMDAIAEAAFKTAVHVIGTAK